MDKRVPKRGFMERVLIERVYFFVKDVFFACGPCAKIH